MPAVLAGRETGPEVFGSTMAFRPPRSRACPTPIFSTAASRRGRSRQDVIVGATAIELHDLIPVPGAGIVSGSTVIALATETLLQGPGADGLEPAAGPRVAPARSGLLDGGPHPASPKPRRPRWGRGRGGGRRRMALCRTRRDGADRLAASVDRRDRALDFAREFDLRQLRLWVSRVETRNTTRLLERVVDDGFDAIVIVDAQGRIMRINEVARHHPRTAGGRPSRRARRSARRARAGRSKGRSRSRTSRRRAEHERRIVCLSRGDDARFLEYTVSTFWLEDRRRRRRGDVRPLRYASLMLHDVTDRERAQERLRFAAFHDMPDGSSQPPCLEAQLDAPGEGPSATALLAFDLDRFKGVNDALGHPTGDAVLVETARRAANLLSGEATLFRIRGRRIRGPAAFGRRRSRPRARRRQSSCAVAVPTT